MNSNQNKPELKLDWIDYKAAEYAVKHWHYSHNMPKSKLSKLGVWEDDKYIGAVIFGLGGGSATNGKRFGLADCFEVAELQRVALTTHKTPVTRIIKIAIKLLGKQSPGIRLLISYADPYHGHLGGIYQGGNWIYIGESSKEKSYKDNKGRLYHSRVVVNAGFIKHYGKYSKCIKRNQLKAIDMPGKYIYLYPLCHDAYDKIIHMRKPYPKELNAQQT